MRLVRHQSPDPALLPLLLRQMSTNACLMYKVSILTVIILARMFSMLRSCSCNAHLVLTALFTGILCKIGNTLPTPCPLCIVLCYASTYPVLGVRFMPVRLMRLMARISGSASVLTSLHAIIMRPIWSNLLRSFSCLKIANSNSRL